MRTKTSIGRRSWQILCALAFLLSVVVAPPQSATPIAHAVDDPRATTGEWGSVIEWGIFGKHMSLLPSGKVLAWPTGQDAFVWDPATNTKVAVPATFGDLHCAAQTQLADGRVLVAGGVIVSPHDGITVTAIFDPATYQWTNATPMHDARWYPTATTLPDGRVLVSSGDMPGGGRANIPEVYDPAADAWTLLPDTAYKDLGLYPQMFVLPNGRVFKAGSTTSTFSLDVNAGTWSNGPTNAFGSSGYAESSAMYAPGKIIRSGGGDPSIANAAIVDMTAVSPAWKQISPMNFPRRRHNMVILADGEVMAVGGTRQADDLGDGIATGAVYEGEIWNPATEQWSVTARMTKDRMYHSSALLLPDGRVLTAGGEYNGRLNAQIFSPPYLFKGARPTIAAAPSTIGYGAGFSVDVTTDGSSITGVALIRLAAVTHAFDHNQRYVPLSFSQSGNSLSVVAPLGGNYAPPGYYQLIVKDSKGVPSVAKIVRVDSTANLTPGSVGGKVTDKTSGDPISGVSVQGGGASTTTDANGDYTLKDVGPGDVQVTFSKNGYATIKRNQPVGGGTTATLDVTLAPPGTIAGKVTNSATGEGIGGAIVTYGGGTVMADGSGNYSIPGVPSGGEIVSASAPGYNSSADLNVDVPANATATFNIALTPKPTFIAGEVRDSQSGLTIPGATVSAGGVSALTDSFGRYQLFVPPGSYDVTVSMDGYATLVRPSLVVTFGSYTAADFGLDPINPAVSFAPAADSYVNSSVAAGNYGTATTMRAVTGTGANPVMASYLRFNVSGLTRAVQSAKLRLFVTNASNVSGSVYLTDNNYAGTATPWAETGINYTNAPTTGLALGTANGAAALSTWVEYDVTAALTGNGTYSFALKNPSTDDVRFSTKEGANPPQLVVQQQPEPAVGSFAPLSGAPGAEVTIAGENFFGVTGVTFNGTPAASFTVDSPTKIRAVVPNGAATGKIGVVIAGSTFLSSGNFSVSAPAPGPSVASFSPASGPAGTEVTIAGTNFVGVTDVTFGGNSASAFTVDSSTKIRAVVPVGATSGKVAVVTSAGQGLSAESFSVIAAEGPKYRAYLSLVVRGPAAAATASASSFRTLAAGRPDLAGVNPYFCPLNER